MSPLLMVAAGIHAHILSQPLADFGWEEEEEEEEGEEEEEVVVVEEEEEEGG